MFLKVLSIDFAWRFWTALYNLHRFYLSGAPAWRLLFFLNPEGCDENTSLSVQDIPMMLQMYEDVVLRLVSDPQLDGKTPRGCLIMDCAVRPASVTTRERERGNKMGVRGLLFWWGRLVPFACFPPGPRCEFWKRGTFNDLQQFVFNKQWQTTSSPPPSVLLRFFLQTFIFAQPSGSHTETDMAPRTPGSW